MYKHIKRDDRVCIALMLKQGHLGTGIAKELGFHRTSISREIERNSDENGIYKVYLANKKARENRKESKVKKRIIDNNQTIRGEVIKYLKRDFSPEQIDGTKANLTRYQANKHSIHDRPTEVNTRMRIGDWEGDTIVGKERKLRIVTYVDRMSGFLIANLTTAKADAIHSLVKQQFRKKPCLTITYDNGSEFALHKMIERDTQAFVCFADKGKPQQRGTNENTNGLLRQYFPKGSSFATLTNNDVQRAVHKLNSRPRKGLNYLTPQQVFESVHFKS